MFVHITERCKGEQAKKKDDIFGEYVEDNNIMNIKEYNRRV